jgi:FkbM family methyltransferase
MTMDVNEGGMTKFASSDVEADDALVSSSVWLSSLAPRRAPGPFPVYEISDALPPSLYQALYDGLPATTGDDWSRERNEAWLTESPVWRRFTEQVMGRRFRVDAIRTLVDGFRDARAKGILASDNVASLLDAHEDPNSFAEALAEVTSTSVLLLGMPRGARNTPHADGGMKLLTILMYFPTPGWNVYRDGGDTLYHDVSPNIVQFDWFSDLTNRRVSEEKLADFAEATTVFHRGRFVANAWSIFVKTKNSFHSVDEITCPSDACRLAVAVNIRIATPERSRGKEVLARIAMLDERADFREAGIVRPVKLSLGSREIWLDAPSMGFVNRWRKTLAKEKEPRTIPWLRRALSADGTRTFWDIGANVGVFSLAARHFRPDISIVAFEPEPNNFLSLCKTSISNDLKVMAYPVALSDTNGVGEFNVHGRFATGLSLHQLGPGRLPPDQTAATIGIATVTGDDLVYGQGLDAPDVVKIDVDGIEDRVVDGMKRLIADRRIAYLAVEASEVTQPKIDRHLGGAGYELDLEPDGTAMWYYRRV